MADALTNLSPSSLLDFVDKNVVISLCDGRKIRGFVYTIDPVSYCIVLVQNTEDITSKTITFVMGHAVKQIHVEKDALLQETASFMDGFVNESTTQYTKESLMDRKVNLKDWLSKNRIPVVESEDDSLCVMGILWIEQPYDSEHCRCTNEIVLDRVRSLVDNMPTGTTGTDIDLKNE